MEDDKQSLLLEIYWRAFNDRQQFIAHKFPVDKCLTKRNIIDLAIINLNGKVT